MSIEWKSWHLVLTSFLFPPVHCESWLLLAYSSLDQYWLSMQDNCVCPVSGFFAPSSGVSNHLTLLAESLPAESIEQSFMPAASSGNRNRCPLPGTIINTNTLEDFKALDKQSLMKAEARKVMFNAHICVIHLTCISGFNFSLDFGETYIPFAISSKFRFGTTFIRVRWNKTAVFF